ncbi:MAG: signal recognition particle protein, partial [Spirochaetales bacterium]|nr:signal recognition particle protein [Spirochaetales bacterium]
VTNGLHYAKKNQYDTVIIDTTGRLQIDSTMMDEIKTLKKISKPDETILVADSMTGQNAVDIAQAFNDELDLSGVILSKFDSDTRGGAALSIKSIIKKPIKFIGTGEKLTDIEPFYPDRIASRILGMGDVVSLVEKAQETIDVEEAEELQRRIEDKTFNLEDYLDQIRRVRKMGSIQSLLEMVPGMKGQVTDDQIDEEEMKFTEAIILSMTKQERKNHRIVGSSRKKRIAQGSGTSVYMVNRLIKKFDKARLMMKKMTNKKNQSKMMSQFGGLS